MGENAEIGSASTSPTSTANSGGTSATGAATGSNNSSADAVALGTVPGAWSPPPGVRYVFDENGASVRLETGPPHVVIELLYTSSLRFLQPGILFQRKNPPPPPPPSSSYYSAMTGSTDDSSEEDGAALPPSSSSSSSSSSSGSFASPWDVDGKPRASWVKRKAAESAAMMQARGRRGRGRGEGGRGEGKGGKEEGGGGWGRENSLTYSQKLC